jgi:excisionase family DNA binding protein
MSDNDSWITAEELAGFLKMPLTSVWRLSRSGQIPCYRLGRLMRFDLGEVREALKAPVLAAFEMEAPAGDEVER